MINEFQKPAMTGMFVPMLVLGAIYLIGLRSLGVSGSTAGVKCTTRDEPKGELGGTLASLLLLPFPELIIPGIEPA